jgi:hypothetical protein
MNTTVSDLAKFAAALVSGNGQNPASRAEMIKPQLPIVTAHQFPPYLPDLPASYGRSMHLSSIRRVPRRVLSCFASLQLCRSDGYVLEDGLFCQSSILTVGHRNNPSKRIRALACLEASSIHIPFVCQIDVRRQLFIEILIPTVAAEGTHAPA